MTLVSILNLSSRMTPADSLLVACNTVFLQHGFVRDMVLPATWF
jgi:hypothetical protein